MRTAILSIFALVLACDKQPEPGTTSSTGEAGSTGTGEAGSTGAGETAGDEELVDAFVEDLRAHLVTHYMQFGDDIAMAGGNTLAEAQDAVTPVLVTELVDPGEDPQGHDFGLFRVLSHPDVVFVGSDIVWYGAYERDTGVLVEIYDFN